MADEAAAKEPAKAADSGGGGGDCPAPPKCPECEAGAPAWLATFSDLCTLLLTFFILLLSFAKTETSKYEAALGSISSATGGQVLHPGEVLMRGKSASNDMAVMESSEPAKPFPIDFLTSEGLLDKLEINRESEEDLKQMRKSLADAELSDSVEIYETAEGIKIELKDKIYFEPNSMRPKTMDIESMTKMINLVVTEGWTLFISGHASRDEVYTDASGAKLDSYALSALRSQAVARVMVKRGVRPQKITSVFYGDSRPNKAFSGTRDAGNVTESEQDRRVEFTLRKTDLNSPGHKVNSR